MKMEQFAFACRYRYAQACRNSRGSLASAPSSCRLCCTGMMSTALPCVSYSRRSVCVEPRVEGENVNIR